MKKTTKILCLILVLSLFALMAMGSGSSSSSSSTTPITSSSNSSSSSSASTPEKKVELPTIEEQVILDQDGVKVTAKEYVNDSFWGDGIKLLIENNSSKNLGVGCNALIVNNYMISDLFSSTIAAGKKSNETLYISSTGLKEAGISNIGQIEVYFHIFDGDTYMTISDAPCAVIKTSDYDKMDTTPNDAGQELYNEGGIRIVGKYLADDPIWGKGVLLFMQNDSGKNVGISCDNMSVNGFMVTPLFSCTVYNGKMAIDDITLLSSELEENGITEVEEVELIFHIFDADSYMTITDSAPITFSTK